jgi:hypothetical protein
MIGWRGDSKKRYIAFLKDICDEKDVYYFIEKDNGQFAFSESNDFFDLEENPLPILPLWSSTYKAYSKVFVSKDNEEFLTIVNLPSSQFVNNMGNFSEERNLVFGFNWNQNLIGLEFTAGQFLRHLKILKEKGEVLNKDLYDV